MGVMLYFPMKTVYILLAILALVSLAPICFITPSEAEDANPITYVSSDPVLDHVSGVLSAIEKSPEGRWKLKDVSFSGPNYCGELLKCTVKWEKY